MTQQSVDQLAPVRTHSGDPDTASSLPAWLYSDPEFFALERERVFRPSWQLVCHGNDIPAAGDYATLELLGELVVAIRGHDGRVRAFHNVCRHRGARLVDGPAGNCGARITCPYHAWTYELDGKLVGVPQRRSYGGLDLSRHDLAPVECEIALGFVFIRLVSGGPGMAEMLAPHLDELRPYRFAELRPMGVLRLRSRAVNWKNATDNYSDGLHVRVGHPSLSSLTGEGYRIEPGEWVQRLGGPMTAALSRHWSARAYQRILPPADHLPESHRRQWLYFKLWPNTALEIYPDQIDFMQFIPVSPTETLLREAPYAVPDDRRAMGLARYLNWRINRVVNREDKDLIERVQAGMGSSSYVAGPLAEAESGLRGFAAKLRDVLPIARRRTAPPPGTIRAMLRDGA